MTLKLTVVIPVRNRPKQVCDAVDSVLKQTYTAEQIIVVDDGSDDDTLQLLQNKYSKEIDIISIKHSGVSRARNIGVESATGDWIAFLDSDDIWHKNKLQLQVAKLEKNKDFNLCHSNEFWFRDGLRVNPKNKHAKLNGNIFIPSLRCCLISPSTVLLNKQKFIDLGGFDETLPACEDYDLWLRWSLKWPVLLCAEELVSRYAGHDDQLSKKYPAMDKFRVQSLLKILNNISLTAGYESALRKVLFEKISILEQGAAKRGLNDEFLYYQKLQKNVFE